MALGQNCRAQAAPLRNGETSMLIAKSLIEPNAAAMSVRTILHTATSHTGVAISLVHRTAGWECAGSGTRNVSEAWGSHYEMRDGTRGRIWFKSEAEARAHFDARKA